MTQIVCQRPGGLELTDRLLAAAALRRGAGVLDVGCGDGATVAHLSDGYGLRATGLDASPARIAAAGEARPELDFVAGRAESLPFGPASFDAVLCECVLSTLDDLAAALAEMARVLTPGGAVLISDVYVRSGPEPPAGGPRALDGCGPRTLGRRATVETLLAGAGLAVELWEDQSGALGRYVWERAAAGSEQAAPDKAPAPGEASLEEAPPRRRPPSPAARRMPSAPGARLGYFICLARSAGAHERSQS